MYLGSTITGATNRKTTKIMGWIIQIAASGGIGRVRKVFHTPQTPSGASRARSRTGSHPSTHTPIVKSVRAKNPRSRNLWLTIYHGAQRIATPNGAIQKDGRKSQCNR